MALGTIRVTNSRGVSTKRIQILRPQNPPPPAIVADDSSPLGPISDRLFDNAGSGFPAGRYIVRAAFEDSGSANTSVTVTDDAEAAATI